MTERVAVVTGANRGIGLEICRQLAAKDITVTLTARRRAEGEETARQLGVAFHLLDVTQADQIQKLVADVEAEYGRLDILVNNAAIYIDEGQAGLEVDIETVRQTIETNLYGPLQLCQAVVPLMKRHNYGRIVNLSSRMGQLAGVGGGSLAYRVSKTALNAVTAVLAAETRGSNILINAMHPGWVKTEMGGRAAPRSVEKGADTAIWLATLPDDGPTGGFFGDRQPMSW